MKTKITRDDFINILVDCNGYDEETAQEMANEYEGSYNEYFEDLGVLEDAINYIN